MLAALQILIGLAAAKSGEVKAETLMAMFNSVGIDADLDTATMEDRSFHYMN